MACSASLARKEAVAVPVASEANSKFRNHCPVTEGLRLQRVKHGDMIWDLTLVSDTYHHIDIIDDITI